MVLILAAVVFLYGDKCCADSSAERGHVFSASPVSRTRGQMWLLCFPATVPGILSSNGGQRFKGKQAARHTNDDKHDATQAIATWGLAEGFER